MGLRGSLDLPTDACVPAAHVPERHRPVLEAQASANLAVAVHELLLAVPDEGDMSPVGSDRTTEGVVSFSGDRERRAYVFPDQHADAVVRVEPRVEDHRRAALARRFDPKGERERFLLVDHLLRELVEVDVVILAVEPQGLTSLPLLGLGRAARAEESVVCVDAEIVEPDATVSSADRR